MRILFSKHADLQRHFMVLHVQACTTCVRTVYLLCVCICHVIICMHIQYMCIHACMQQLTESHVSVGYMLILLNEVE